VTCGVTRIRGRPDSYLCHPVTACSASFVCKAFARARHLMKVAGRGGHLYDPVRAPSTDLRSTGCALRALDPARSRTRGRVHRGAHGHLASRATTHPRGARDPQIQGRRARIYASQRLWPKAGTTSASSSATAGTTRITRASCCPTPSVGCSARMTHTRWTPDGEARSLVVGAALFQHCSSFRERVRRAEERQDGLLR
jgi:hypothetical protein